MVCPEPRSGMYGVVGRLIGEDVTLYNRIRNWNLNINTNPHTLIYTGTRFGTQRAKGVLRTSGTFEGFGGEPPLFPGDSFTFFGFTAPDTGVACTEGCAEVVPAIVNTLTINWDWTVANRGITWNIGFASNGVPVQDIFDHPCEDEVFCDPGCPPVPVFVDPCIPPTPPAEETLVEWCNLVTAQLSFTANLIEFSNSTTNCAVRNVPGNLDWTLDILDQNPCIIPVLERDYLIRMFTTPDRWWELRWGFMQDVNNFRVNIETAEIISKNNVLSMQAVLCCTDDTPVRGRIITPDGVIVWPYLVEGES